MTTHQAQDASARPFVVTLDGPAASGKSSVGLGAARRLGFRFFDTGLVYRALTWLALAKGVDVDDEAGLTALVAKLGLAIDPLGRVFRGGVDITQDLQQPSVTAAVSRVAAHARVREALRPMQRALVETPGVVMAGRDIGTVIVPEAQLKVWLNASAEERARRRAAQAGDDYAHVLSGMRQRDLLDASREVAPMARAADAITLETDGRTLEEVIAEIVSLARARGAASVPDRA